MNFGVCVFSFGSLVQPIHTHVSQQGHFRASLLRLLPCMISQCLCSYIWWRHHTVVKQLKSLDVAPVPLPGPVVGFPVLAGPAAGRGGVVLRGHGWRRGGWDHSG